MTDRTVTVREVADRYGVAEHTVRTWIRSGELGAVNVGRRRDAKRPRWRVSEAALAAFEAARSAAGPQPTRPRRRASTAKDVIEFYRTGWAPESATSPGASRGTPRVARVFAGAGPSRRIH